MSGGAAWIGGGAAGGGGEGGLDQRRRGVEEEEARLARRRGVEEEEAREAGRLGGSQVAWGARVVGWAEVAGRLGVGPGRLGGRKLPRKWGGGRRQIHVRPEKVGTSFCLQFVLFSSRDLALINSNMITNHKMGRN
jgi:hypothetical protein